VKRVERRLLRINDALAALAREEALVAGELEMHRHLDDDAQRDAAVYDSPGHKAEAYESRKDVARFRRALEGIRGKRSRLERKRLELLQRLGGEEPSGPGDQ
jgi:hypothetical protein